MFRAIDSDYLVPFDWSYRVDRAPTLPPAGDRPKRVRKQEKERRDRLERDLEQSVERFGELQRKLYAENRWSLLLVFQAMDAAGKDSTIRAVTSGVNPAGFQVFSFKQPSERELDHDFLWRTAQRLPERGRVGVFNRSYYEEVLVVRVHPEYLSAQNLPSDAYDPARLGALWSERYESIVEHERHLARSGTVVLKFFLNVSREEQRRRFLARLDSPDKNWKFSEGDLRESALWPAYMEAYEDALNATSKPWAPWYSIPADDKRFMRKTVAGIVVSTLESMDLRYPSVSAARQRDFGTLASQLRAMIEEEPGDAR